MQHAESRQKGAGIQRKTAGQVHFQICKACFWCASYLGGDDSIVRCPSCGRGPVESIPILSNEQYRFDYHPKRGVTLEFSAVVH